MIRAPYKPRSGTGLNYTETIASDADFCWGNSAYLMMQRIVVAFSKYNWAAAIRGPEGGGLVENLPIYLQDKAILGDFGMKCPLEVSINDTREKELSDFGLIALCHKKMSNQAVFFSGQSIQQAQKYDTSDATANAVLSTRLPYMLNASRFAHYMKVMLRNKIGTFQSKDQVQAYLQNWLGQYVLLSGQGQDLQAKYPLSEGLVTVTDDLSTPGEYSVSLSLKPNFQLEGVRVSISFVARLGQKTS
jgi:type VI secretion system protein ImpC